MTMMELRNLIALKLGISSGAIDVEKFSSGAVRFNYQGNRYRVSSGLDLNVEKVDGACLVTDSDARQLEKLLRGEQWDGTGLPPVGTICQMRDDNDKWVDVEIIANHKGFAHGWQDSTEDTYYSNKPSEFLPRRTEREKAVEKIQQVLNVGHNTDEDAENIYDAIVAGKIDGLGKVG